MLFPVILPCAPNLTKIILGLCLAAEAIDVWILHINAVTGQQLAFQ
jgi:multisubunit Na+/H+ antiporter MnhC subunit